MTRRFVITGASKGIGAAVAGRLARSGHVPVGIARSAPDGFPGEFHEVDLADRDATTQVVERILDHGDVDGIINNVGLVRPASLGEVDLADLDAVLDLGLRAAVQLTQALVPGMVDRGWGRIVNITSLVTLGLPERTAYGSSKAALEFLARAWAGSSPRQG